MPGDGLTLSARPSHPGRPRIGPGRIVHGVRRALLGLGVAACAPALAAPPEVIIDPGGAPPKVLQAITNAVGAITAAPAGAGAWSQGMLTVIDWRLGDFITELSRYRPGVLRCDPGIANVRLSGAFRIDNTDTILENLSQSLPVTVRFITRYWATVEAA